MVSAASRILRLCLRLGLVRLEPETAGAELLPQVAALALMGLDPFLD